MKWNLLTFADKIFLFGLNSVIRFHGVKGDQFRGLGAPSKTWSERYNSSRRQHQPPLTPFTFYLPSLPSQHWQGWIAVTGFHFTDQLSTSVPRRLELIKLYGSTVLEVYIQYPPVLTLYWSFHLQPCCHLNLFILCFNHTIHNWKWIHIFHQAILNHSFTHISMS